MNALRNKVNLIGRLGQNPDIRTFDNDKKLARLSIVTNERYKNTSGEFVTDVQWHTVIAWGKQAEYLERYFEKGNNVALEGKLVSRNYTDKNGESKYITEIHLNEIIKIGQNKEVELA